MKILVLVIVVVIAAIILLAGVAALIGSRLSKSHTATRSIFLRQSPQNVYNVIRDFPSAPSWRSDVKRVEVQTRAKGNVHLREEGKNGTVNYELVEDVPGKRMVTQILDTDLGYSGKWTYVFAPENGGARVTITEDGEVSNALFRFMSRYVIGHTATLDAYLSSLARRFGEDTMPK
jgi:uncharacterized membrane protein